MATMIGEVYDALLEAGASNEKARQAAEAVAVFDGRFGKLEQDSVDRASQAREQVASLRQEQRSDISDLKLDIAGVKAEIKLLKWMLGATFAGVVAILIRLFFP